MMLFKKININQPKYMLPLILYFPILGTSYFIFDMFATEISDVPDKNMTTTEYLNPTLPQAQVKGDGIGGKYESMVKSYGKIEDFTAIDNIDANDEKNKEAYDSKYTDKDLAILDANAALDEKGQEQSLHDKLQESAKKGSSLGENEEERLARSQEEQQKVMDELNRALAQLRLNGQSSPSDTTERRVTGKIEINEKLVQKPNKDDEPQQVVKRVKKPSDYFHTLADNEPEPKLIKAIIDEDIKAVDGSRVRLRLLDDIEINEAVLPKGSYLYAIMSGFGSQRVKGNVSSVLIDDEITKISLSIYDTDGLEGLYVPSSSFRETTKDIASGAMGGSMNMGTGSNDNSLSQWGMQAIQNAYQKTSNAISKAIKKNKVKLKYGTFVYLVNGKDQKK